MNNNLLIYVGETYLHPLKEINDAKIYLNNKGQIIIDELIIPDDRQRNFRRMYNFSKDYLEKKKLPLDISKFWRKDLNDIVFEMARKKQKYISLDALDDIRHCQNQIAGIRDAVITRIRKFVRRKWIKTLRKRQKNSNIS
jgi:hypothetical protein